MTEGSKGIGLRPHHHRQGCGPQSGGDLHDGGCANAALSSFTKTPSDLAVKSGVLVTAVSPGPVEAERWDSSTRQQAAALGVDLETYAKGQ